MLSIFTRNANLVVPSPHIRLGERKGAGLILLLCCVFSVLAVASAQAQGPPPGAWSNPVTTITGSQTVGYVTSTDGATYGMGTSTYSVNSVRDNLLQGGFGGYYTTPGYNFYWGLQSFDLTVKIVYTYTLAPGETYQSGYAYYSNIVCDTWADENCPSYQPQAANNGLGDTGVLTTSSSYFATESQGVHRLEGSSFFEPSTNTVTVTYTIKPNASSANHDGMNWNAVSRHECIIHAA